MKREQITLVHLWVLIDPSLGEPGAVFLLSSRRGLTFCGIIILPVVMSTMLMVRLAGLLSRWHFSISRELSGPPPLTRHPLAVTSFTCNSVFVLAVGAAPPPPSPHFPGEYINPLSLTVL